MFCRPMKSYTPGTSGRSVELVEGADVAAAACRRRSHSRTRGRREGPDPETAEYSRDGREHPRGTSPRPTVPNWPAPRSRSPGLSRQSCPRSRSQCLSPLSPGGAVKARPSLIGAQPVDVQIHRHEGKGPGADRTEELWCPTWTCRTCTCLPRRARPRRGDGPVSDPDDSSPPSKVRGKRS